MRDKSIGGNFTELLREIPLLVLLKEIERRRMLIVWRISPSLHKLVAGSQALGK